MAAKFGTSGLRGLATELGDVVFVALDFRASNPDLQSNVAQAMAKGSASVMITGSHIPANRNGLKFYRPDGEIAGIEVRYRKAFGKSSLKGLRVGVYQHSTVARAASVRNRFTQDQP